MSDRAVVAAEGPILDEILAATYDIWHDGLPPAAYRRYYAAQRATPWGRRHLSRVALVEHDTVLASAKEYWFDASLDGRAIRVAGLGAIFTQPAHRGRGAARELVGRMLDKAAADGLALALLFSEIGADYYARLGFTPIATRESRFAVVEPPRHGAPMTMVRAGEERDVAEIVEMCAVRAAPYRFHLDRDRDLVQFAIVERRLLAGLGPAGAREAQFFVAEEGNYAAAYLVVTVRGDEWTIEECGDRDPAGARLGALLQALVARDPSARRPPIRGWLPAGMLPPQVTVVDRTPSRDVMMVLPLSDAGRSATSLREDDLVFWPSDKF